VPHATALRVLVASAGVVPDGRSGESEGTSPPTAERGRNLDELGRFAGTLGRASWWASLGRDAATLARLAVRQLPNDAATAVSAVANRRLQARDALANAKAPLWSTEANGWAGAHTVHRTVCAVESPSK
jgi:hypothetical protein